MHFKTLANSVRWMVSGKYKPGMSEAVAELMAAQTAERSADGDANGVEIEELNQDQDLSGFGDDDDVAVGAVGICRLDGQGDGLVLSLKDELFGIDLDFHG